jgi:hypothetical protein
LRLVLELSGERLPSRIQDALLSLISLPCPQARRYTTRFAVDLQFCVKNE